MELTKQIEKELIFEFIVFVIGIAAISMFFKNNLILLLILIAVWGISIAFWHRKIDIIFYIVGAIIGPVAEIVCINYGVWQYANPSFLGIPIWLPLAWGFAVVMIKRVAETIAKIN